MFEKITSLFEKKAVGDRTGLSYNGATFGFNSELETNTTLYYKLYRQNTDLRRCVEELYQTVGKDGYTIKDGENELRNSPVESALNFENGFNTLKSLIIRDLSIAGNVFILPIKNGGGTTIGFQVLDPRTMRILANKHGEVVKYVQTRGGNVQDFGPDELYHFKDMLDPDNEVMGISKVETLVYSIMGDKESEKSNYAFFKNNAIPSTIITLENDLDENEIKSAIATLKSQFSGGANKHKISASTGIKDVKQVGSSMKDMEFATLRGFTTERICASMGVPKTILGYSDGVNYSTSDNQYRHFIENTIRPLTGQLENILNLLIRELNPRIKLEFIDKHSFDIDDKVKRNIDLLNNGVKTINEAREDLGLELSEEEITDKLLIKNNLVLLEDVGTDIFAPLKQTPKNWD